MSDSAPTSKGLRMQREIYRWLMCESIRGIIRLFMFKALVALLLKREEEGKKKQLMMWQVTRNEWLSYVRDMLSLWFTGGKLRWPFEGKMKTQRDEQKHWENQLNWEERAAIFSCSKTQLSLNQNPTQEEHLSSLIKDQPALY